MPQGKVLYQGQPAATAAAIYTAAYDTRINYAVAINNDSSARTLKLWVGGSDATNVILPATSLDASGGRAEQGGGIFLAKGQALYAQASAASQVTLTVFGDIATDGGPLPAGPAVPWKFFDTAGREKSVQAIGELADVGDVTITAVADNEVLAYDSTGTAWINQTAAEAGLATATHTHGIDDLDDATITGLTDGEVLLSSSDVFINQTLAEASIAAADHNHGTNGVKTKQSTADVSNPPTSAELTSAFGAVGTVGDGFVAVLDDNGAGSNYWLVAVVNGVWTYAALTATV